MGFEPSNATVRWTVAREHLASDTMIFAEGKNVTNPIIHCFCLGYYLCWRLCRLIAGCCVDEECFRFQAFLFGNRDGQHDFVLRFPPLRYGGDAGQLDFRQRLA